MANLSYGTGSSSYYDLARRQQVFIATANVTAPVIYTTAAGTGGPLLWNNSVPAGIKRVMALLLAVGVSMTTVSTARFRFRDHWKLRSDRSSHDHHGH